jgi:hypothetical protein
MRARLDRVLDKFNGGVQPDKAIVGRLSAELNIDPTRVDANPNLPSGSLTRVLN